MFKDKEKQREYDRERMRRKRVEQKPLADVLPHAQSRTKSPVIPDENVLPDVLPIQLTPAEPYDEQAALTHMMSMHPVYSDKTITTSGGVVLHPVIGWQEGETWKSEPSVIEVDQAKKARLKKVIKELELVKLAH